MAPELMSTFRKRLFWSFFFLFFLIVSVSALKRFQTQLRIWCLNVFLLITDQSEHRCGSHRHRQGSLKLGWKPIKTKSSLLVS